jgi:hypothetical protein
MSSVIEIQVPHFYYHPRGPSSCEDFKKNNKIPQNYTGVVDCKLPNGESETISFVGGQLSSEENGKNGYYVLGHSVAKIRWKNFKQKFNKTTVDDTKPYVLTCIEWNPNHTEGNIVIIGDVIFRMRQEHLIWVYNKKTQQAWAVSEDHYIDQHFSKNVATLKKYQSLTATIRVGLEEIKQILIQQISEQKQ